MREKMEQNLTAKLLVMQRIEDAYALIESISTEQFSNGSRETILAVIADELKFQVGKVEEFGDKIQAKIAEKTHDLES